MWPDVISYYLWPGNIFLSFQFPRSTIIMTSVFRVTSIVQAHSHCSGQTRLGDFSNDGARFAQRKQIKITKNGKKNIRISKLRCPSSIIFRTSFKCIVIRLQTKDKKTRAQCEEVLIAVNFWLVLQNH